MYPLSIFFAAFCTFVLSALAAPLPSLDKRTYYGEGTWFYDGLGACGYWNTNSDSIVALSSQIYSASYCNQYVTVTNTATGQTAYGMVRDECPSCGASDLDMSIGLFEQLGNLQTGVLSIAWDFEPVGFTPP